MKLSAGKVLNRELSWLEFNTRVLDEAADRLNPPLERLKFISIFSGNLDEFYMVRVAGIKHSAYKKEDHSGLSPESLLQQINARAKSLVKRQYKLFHKEIRPALESEGIRLKQWQELSSSQKESLRRSFISDILPVLTPIGIDPSHPFPLLPNLGLELLIRLRRPEEKQIRYAVMEIPQGLPRFIELENNGTKYSFLPLDELICGNIDLLFNGCEIVECSEFRVTRDMDFSIDEETVADLLSEMRDALQRNAKRPVIRLEIASSMKAASRKWLCEKLAVPPEHIYSIDGLMNLKSCFEIASLDRPDLLPPPMEPLASIAVRSTEPVFESIRRNGSILLHHPYESFAPVIRFLNEAADDPDVLAIKQTLYRVSGDSPIVKALMRAARNGKQVTVLVELKARFDEENNINWALELDRAGANVIYGVANLKVHCKTLLVVRREKDGVRRYIHIGTGNYNDKTARQYTDLGLFTDDKVIAADCSSLFNVITGFSNPPAWNKLLAAPFNMLERLLYMIDREAELSTLQNPGSIRIKINALIDPEIIKHLYAAAKKHVKIELAVRGICGLNPEILPEKTAKNITVVSILDRFLEHSRIFRFGNNGSPEYYIGSSDLMQRNLRRRIEILVPVEKEEIRRELDFILNTVLSDRRKGRRLLSAYHYSRTWTGKEEFESTRAQSVLYQYYRERLKKSEAAIKQCGSLTVFHSPEKES